MSLAHRARSRHVTAVADAALDGEPAPVRVLGIDETRRGKAKWDTDPDTGKRIWVDRWDTGLVDSTGDQGLLAQVNGRDSATVIDWLEERDADWRAAITHVAIDLSMVYARAARVGLPGAIVIADRFHLVKKAKRHGRCGTPPWRLGPARPARPQGRRRVDQPLPAAGR